ncbi:MAG: hypothetical protein IRZ19_09880 [Pyrinomonas methylaliphatogenes]|jgi:uncharacterized protein (TIGR00725 family)|nr:hypothetical protein [Pyrinomonas methylaliphatogenes]
MNCGKIKIGVMGSAADTLPTEGRASLEAKGEALGQAIAARRAVLLTGATTGIPYLVGRAAKAAGAFHIGISPAANRDEHVKAYGLPLDACDVIIYTGFGLKGRNVVLVRSCDIAIFVGGSIGSLNEFTIAYDEGRIIGCLTGTGGVADCASQLLEAFPKRSTAQLLFADEPNFLLAACLKAYEERGG